MNDELEILKDRLGASVVARLEELSALGEGEVADRVREVAFQASDIAARKLAGEDTAALESALRARVKMLEAAGAITAASAVHGAIRDTFDAILQALFSALVRRI
jgi:hypothetical protein